MRIGDHMVMTTAAPPLAANDPFEAPGAASAVVSWPQKLVTLVIVVGPALALAPVVALLWGHAVNLTDIVMGLVLYVVTGFGVTIGFHRLFTHRSFKSARLLKIA